MATVAELEIRVGVLENTMSSLLVLLERTLDRLGASAVTDDDASQSEGGA